jgi:hypothetical protein
MLVIMSVLSKILAALSMVCYVATSSIAAAHAFPMMGGIGTSDSIALETSTMVSKEANQAVGSEAMMDCHQDANSSADSGKVSSICKIFCSAIGHALLSTELVEISSIFHNTSPRLGSDSLTTRQLSVEHQPPK